jgi:hypothetical protein
MHGANIHCTHVVFVRHVLHLLMAEKNAVQSVVSSAHLSLHNRLGRSCVRGDAGLDRTSGLFDLNPLQAQAQLTSGLFDLAGTDADCLTSIARAQAQELDCLTSRALTDCLTSIARAQAQDEVLFDLAGTGGLFD